MGKYIGILEAIWVHEHGAKIYLWLLERGEKSIADLTKITSLYRVEIYRQLPFLLESWLVIEVIKGKRKNYIAATPHKIQDLYTKQQEDVYRHVDALVEKYAYQDKKPKVIYQEWKKALMYVFSDIVNSLDAGDVFYRVSSERDVDLANEYLPKNYRETRDRKQLERYVIMSESGASKKAPRLERELLTRTRWFSGQCLSHNLRR
jgi:predicted transcriptional regulator